jgi:hypothetical protein
MEMGTRKLLQVPRIMGEKWQGIEYFHTVGLERRVTVYGENANGMETNWTIERIVNLVISEASWITLQVHSQILWKSDDALLGWWTVSNKVSISTFCPSPFRKMYYDTFCLHTHFINQTYFNWASHPSTNEQIKASTNVMLLQPHAVKV